MSQATGIFKQVAIKREASYGVIPAASAAQLLRRVTSTLDLQKDTYQSNEIRPAIDWLFCLGSGAENGTGPFVVAGRLAARAA